MTSHDADQGVDTPSEASKGGRNAEAGPASVLKALQLLDAFHASSGDLGVSELARSTGLPVSTAYRLLSHLVDGGYVNKDGTRYGPGDKLVELGSYALNQRTQALGELAAPHLGDLYSRCGSTTRLGLLDGTEVIIVDKVVGLQTTPAPTPVGDRVTAFCTALGKAQLAFLDPRVLVGHLQQQPLPRRTRYSVTSPEVFMQQMEQIRTTRIAFDREESVVGQVCLATPLLVDGEVRGAISVSHVARRIDYRQSAEALLQTARQIQRKLAAVG